MAENKVQFNLYNVHYAVITPDNDGAPVFGTPVHVPGAVTLTLDPVGSMDPFYADGVIYYMSQSNNGYTGSLEMARVPEQMLIDVWGFAQDATSKILTESANVETKEVALMFQIDGDQDDECFTLYRCMLSRPNAGSTTNTDTKTPQTRSMDLTAAPIVAGTKAGQIMAKSGAETPAATKTAWFSAVA